MSSLDRSLIASFPAFSGFTTAQLDDVLADARSIRCGKGCSLLEQGERATSFFLLLHGVMRVLMLTPAGEKIVMRHVVAGEFLGLAKAIGRDTYPLGAQAVVDSVALVWPAKTLLQLTDRYPQLGAVILQTVGVRLQDAYSRVEISSQAVERRIAHMLLRMANQAGERCGTGVEIGFPVSRQTIAEMTASTLPTVSRILSAWQGRGLIRSGRKKIVITNRDELQKLADARASQNAPGVTASRVLDFRAA